MASTKETTPTPSFPVTVAPTYFSTRAFALHSIAISYALSWPPHVYLFGKLMKASNYAYSNIVPRVQLETLTPNLPKATTDMLWRARGCHLNTLETFPLFAAAMVSLPCPLYPSLIKTCTENSLQEHTPTWTRKTSISARQSIWLQECCIACCT